MDTLAARGVSCRAGLYYKSRRPGQPVPASGRRTKVKDFKKGMATIPKPEQDFLHQYMTLTKCDLYFADKAILVEGTTERVLMPRCEIVDRDLDEEHKLAKQYITTVEVGGAYAHIFYPLLKFLELKTLVITDLDAVRSVTKKDRKGNDRNVWEKCPVALGERTSNAAIREWFRPAGDEGEAEAKPAPDIDMKTLLAKTDAEKAFRLSPHRLSGAGNARIERLCAQL